MFWHAFNYVHLGSYLQFCRMLIASMLKEKHESMSEQTVTPLGGGLRKNSDFSQTVS